MTTTALDLVEQLGETGSLQVEAWPDQVIDRLGHDPRSAYVERFWLPILGPSTIFLLRHIADGLERRPDGWRLNLNDTARALGLGERQGRNAPFARTLARAVDFEMARLVHDRLAVRRFLPPLARRHVARLPEALREQHERHNQCETPRNGGVPEPGLQLRGRQLALSLLQLGESPTAVARQLDRWRFSPTLAAECLQWASEHPGRLAGQAVASPASR